MVYKCGFAGYKDCTEKCRFFETCMRNPQRKKRKGGDSDGRCKVDQDNNRCI